MDVVPLTGVDVDRAPSRMTSSAALVSSLVTRTETWRLWATPLHASAMGLLVSPSYPIYHAVVKRVQTEPALSMVGSSRGVS